MAIANNEIQVTWSAASSLSVAAGGTATSDTFTIGATAVELAVQIKADNGGTPAAGDTLDAWLHRTAGDPDGAGADEYDTTIQGEWLAQLDTNTTDPAQRTAAGLSAVSKSGRLYVRNNSAARSITVSAIVYEKTVS